MKVAVLVSAGKHPASGQARHCRNDGLALQMGLNLSKNSTESLRVLHAGDANNGALQDYLALGAPHIEVMPTTDNLVDNLASQLNHTNLILTGTRAENGQDSGLLPYLLAAKLNWPIVANALEITPHGSELEILQFLPKGARRRVTLKLPAVVAVHPLAAVELHYVYAQQHTGRISSLPAHSGNSTDSMQWRTETARKPIKLVAKTTQTGHERLMAAISSKAKGGAVVNEGNNVEKAQVILRYLREHQLIDF